MRAGRLSLIPAFPFSTPCPFSRTTPNNTHSPSQPWPPSCPRRRRYARGLLPGVRKGEREKSGERDQAAAPGEREPALPSNLHAWAPPLDPARHPRAAAVDGASLRGVRRAGRWSLPSAEREAKGKRRRARLPAAAGARRRRPARRWPSPLAHTRRPERKPGGPPVPVWARSGARPSPERKGCGPRFRKGNHAAHFFAPLSPSSPSLPPHHLSPSVRRRRRFLRRAERAAHPRAGGAGKRWREERTAGPSSLAPPPIAPGRRLSLALFRLTPLSSLLSFST